MEAGRSVVAFGVALSEVEESYRCHFERDQTWPRVEGTEGRHVEGEGVGGIAGRSHFRVAPARKKGEKHCGGSKRLSAGGRARRRMISGLEFLPLWRERQRDSGLGD
jgi:hypothetical protein